MSHHHPNHGNIELTFFFVFFYENVNQSHRRRRLFVVNFKLFSEIVRELQQEWHYKKRTRKRKQKFAFIVDWIGVYDHLTSST